MDQEKIKERWVKALRFAAEIWKEAKMPTIFDNECHEAGKVALAVLAAKIYDQLDDS